MNRAVVNIHNFTITTMTHYTMQQHCVWWLAIAIHKCAEKQEILRRAIEKTIAFSTEWGNVISQRFVQVVTAQNHFLVNNSVYVPENLFTLACGTEDVLTNLRNFIWYFR